MNCNPETVMFSSGYCEAENQLGRIFVCPICRMEIAIFVPLEVKTHSIIEFEVDKDGSVCGSMQSEPK